MNLWWHFRWTKRLMQSMLVQHPDWLRSPGRLSESALNLLYLSVQLKKSSKSMPAHSVDNTEATVLSHKYHLIVYVVAGPIQLVYAPPLLLAADCTHENNLYSCKSEKRVTGPTWHVRQPAQGPYSLGSWAGTPPGPKWRRSHTQGHWQDWPRLRERVQVPGPCTYPEILRWWKSMWRVEWKGK